MLKTWTSIILPLDTIGFNWASFPFLRVIKGFLCKFNVVDPYSVPSSYKYAPVISPVTIGVKVKLPVIVDPKETFAETSIGGYSKIWYPDPVVWISTCLFLNRSVVIVAAAPTLINLNESESTTLTEYLVVVDNPKISVPVVEYKTTSFVLNPWSLNVIVL